jgi:endonuclease YncB( thermonuclease family)
MWETNHLIRENEKTRFWYNLRLYRKSVLNELLVLFWIAFLVLLSPLSVSAEWEARVVHVFDGDTLVVSRDGLAKIVRLYSIDCPEITQSFGLEAKGFTMGLVSGKKIKVIPVVKKSIIKFMVYIPDKCINKELLEAGYAWCLDDDSSEKEWKKLEQNARLEKRGLWSIENPIPPWEFKDERKRTSDQRSHTIKWGDGKHTGGASTVDVGPPKKRRRRR